MPYITQNYREELIPMIDALAQKIASIHKANPTQTRDGLMNYTVSEIIAQVFPDARYTDMNEIIGFLECCKLEYYRKKAGPYEDLKESQNGPVRDWDTGNKKGY